MKFPINSDQLTLLYHLEHSSSLEQLASALCKEKSVVSKNLKALHMSFPSLIKKENRRWVVTKQGLVVNKTTSEYISSLDKLIPRSFDKSNEKLYNSMNAVFMIVNPQKAFEDLESGPISNPKAVENIRQILNRWRELGRKVIFVKHVSKSSESPLAPGLPTSDFIEALEPLPKEIVLEKSVLSAFHDIKIDDDLNPEEWDCLILAGFTAAECMNATAKDAHELDIPTYVVADAVSTTNLIGPNGEVFHSKLVLGVTLASLHQNIASILDTDLLLSEIS